MHKDRPIFTAQFHPEHFGGPTDTEVIVTSFSILYTISLFLSIFPRQNKTTIIVAALSNQNCWSWVDFKQVNKRAKGLLESAKMDSRRSGSAKNRLEAYHFGDDHWGLPF